MAAAFVQSKSSAILGTTTASTIPVTLGATVTSGNLVCGGVAWDDGGGTVSLSSVTDDKGNSYTVQRTTTDATNGQRGATFFKDNITNGPVTITANLSSSTGSRAISIHEVSGLQATPLDVETGQVNASPGTGTDGATSGAVTTTADGDYIFGFFEDTAAYRANTELTAGTGFTKREETGVAGTTLCIMTEDLIQSSAGSIAATATHANNDATISMILTFKATGGSAGTPNRKRMAGTPFMGMAINDGPVRTW